jgi:5'-3' exonuclease
MYKNENKAIQQKALKTAFFLTLSLFEIKVRMKIAFKRFTFSAYFACLSCMIKIFFIVFFVASDFLAHFL